MHHCDARTIEPGAKARKFAGAPALELFDHEQAPVPPFRNGALRIQSGRHARYHTAHRIQGTDTAARATVTR